ncbi:hypothetical protein N9989_00130 [bacterium]|nr:hypothetical protein [bacterium]
MLTVKAHIENNNYESVIVRIVTLHTGAVLETYEIQRKPSEETLREAYDWINSKYLNIDIATQGFSSNPAKNKFNASGKLREKSVVFNPSASSSLVTFEEYVQENTLSVATPAEIRSSLQGYDEFMKQSGLSSAASQDTSFEEECSDTEQDQLKQSLDGSISTINGTEYSTLAQLAVADNLLPTETEADPILDQEALSRHTMDSTINATYGRLLNRTSGVLPSTKPLVNLGGMPGSSVRSPSATKDASDGRKGIAGDHMAEPVPGFKPCKGDQIISNNNNASIVLTRDRNSVLTSGYGGKGNSQAAAIDIVCGRMSPTPRAVDDKDSPIQVSPMFVPVETEYGTLVDAARMYISQKSDIDSYFNIVEGTIGNSEARSAVGIKADSVRLVANEGIKLVTKTDKINSQGGRIKKIRGVDIIANNDDKNLQPMTLGDNTAECISDLANIVDSLVGALQTTINNVAQLDVALATHVHPSPFFGAPTLPSPNGAPQCLASLIEFVSVETFSNSAMKWNINSFKWKYLRQGSARSIRSKFNNVN